MTKILIRCLCALLLCASSATLMAKEVVLQHNGLRLNAALDLASGKQLADGVILVTHGALAHRDMEMLVYIRKLLNDMGHNSLAINLSLGIDNRHDMYDCKTTHRHQNEDAVSEINAWVDWLEKQGVKKIRLLGHSRGGAQTALYAVTHDRPLIQSLILLAPATQDNTSAVAYELRYKQPFKPVLEKATGLVRNGEANTVIENVSLMTCSNTAVTAGSFLSYYGPQAQVDAPTLLKNIHKPVLVIAGGKDDVVVDLKKKITPLISGRRIQLRVIESAGHMFRDLNSDDVVDAINEFIVSLK